MSDNVEILTLDGIDFKIDGDTLNGTNLNGKRKITEFPSKIKKIGESAFSGCYYLEDIILPNGITEIGNAAFSECSALKNIIIPDTVTEIGDAAFSGCYCLEDIIIPNGVTEIGTQTFFNCFNILNMKIPDTVTKIGKSAFSGCYCLEDIIIPNGVTEIDDAAFSGCSALENIIIPDTVTEIGDAAFSGCNNLETIEIPNSITKIGIGAFRGCQSLKNIILDLYDRKKIPALKKIIYKLLKNTKIKFKNTNDEKWIHVFENYINKINKNKAFNILNEEIDINILKENINLLIASGINEDKIIELINNNWEIFKKYSIINNFYKNCKYLSKQKTLTSEYELMQIIFNKNIDNPLKDYDNIKTIIESNVNKSNIELLLVFSNEPTPNNQLELRRRFIICNVLYPGIESDNIQEKRTIINRESYENIIIYDNNRFGKLDPNKITSKLYDNKYFEGIKYPLTIELNKINPNIIKLLTKNADHIINSLNIIKNWDNIDLYKDKKEKATYLKNEIIGRVLYSIIKINIDNYKKDNPEKSERDILEELYNENSELMLSYDITGKETEFIEYFKEDFNNASHINQGSLSNEDHLKYDIIGKIIKYENPYLFDIYRGYGISIDRNNPVPDKDYINNYNYNLAAECGYYFNPEEKNYNYSNIGADKQFDIIARLIINDIGISDIPDEEKYIKRLNAMIDDYYLNNRNSSSAIYRAIVTFLEKNKQYDLQKIKNNGSEELNKQIFDDNSRYTDNDRMLYCLYMYNRLAHSIDEIDTKKININYNMYKIHNKKINQTNKLAELKNALKSYKNLEYKEIKPSVINKILDSIYIKEIIESYHNNKAELFNYIKEKIANDKQKSALAAIKIILNEAKNKDELIDKIEQFVREYELSETEKNELSLKMSSMIVNVEDIINSVHILQNNVDDQIACKNLSTLNLNEKIKVLDDLYNIGKIDKDVREDIKNYSNEQILFYKVKSLIGKRLIDNIVKYIEKLSEKEEYKGLSEKEKRKKFFIKYGYITEKQDGGNSNVLVCYSPKFESPLSVHMPKDNEEGLTHTIMNGRVYGGLKERTKMAIEEVKIISKDQNGHEITIGEICKDSHQRLIIDPPSENEIKFIDFKEYEKEKYLPFITYVNFFNYDIFKIKDDIQKFINEPHTEEEYIRFKEYILDIFPFTNKENVFVKKEYDDGKATRTIYQNIFDIYKVYIGFDNIVYKSEITTMVENNHNDSDIEDNKQIKQ